MAVVELRTLWVWCCNCGFEVRNRPMHSVGWSKREARAAADTIREHEEKCTISRVGPGGWSERVVALYGGC